MTAPSSASRARLTGIGVGPGDPRHLTRLALDVLDAADRVVAPTTAADEVGRAEGIVRAALPELAITRLVFDMALNDQDRRHSHDAAARVLRPWLQAGEHVAFVTLGDPNVYSTFPALVSALEALGWHGPVDTVPGITAFQALAAASGTVLLDGVESLSLVTALDGPAHLAEALADERRTVVVYKGGRYLHEIAELLALRGRLDGAVVGELLGLPGERIEPLAKVADRPASYLATVIVPPVPS